MEADRDIYETSDGRLVEADDPDAAALIARAGASVRDKTAARLGLKLDKGKVTQPAGEAKPVPSSAADPEPEAKPEKAAVAPFGTKDVTAPAPPAKEISAGSGGAGSDK